jgi:cyclohexa-1,5-dienecarbonyl-CoA hydratase
MGETIADLLREGWTRRTVADGDRLREIAAYYGELGYEVRLLPAGEEDMDASCRACLGPGGAEGAQVIYTRGSLEGAARDRRTAMDDAVRYRESEGVGWITWNRPPLNVLDIEALETLAGLLRDAKKREVRILVLSGEGERAFSAGVDVADHVGDRAAALIGSFHKVFRDLFALEVPVVGLAKGLALGGGCELLLGCDVVYAADNLKIGQPEIRLGLFPPVAAVLLPRLIPEKRAWEMILTGETMGAMEAQSLGLVNRVFPMDECDEGAGRRIAALAELSGAALRHAKRALVAARGLGRDEAIHLVERLYLDELMDTEDAGEGLAAFLEKRPPRWRHR